MIIDLILIWLNICLCITIFFLLKGLKKEEKPKQKPKKIKNKLSKQDKVIQQRVIKQIENFLNYDGEVQEDIE